MVRLISLTDSRLLTSFSADKLSHTYSIALPVQLPPILGIVLFRACRKYSDLSCIHGWPEFVLFKYLHAWAQYNNNYSGSSGAYPEYYTENLKL